MTLRILVENDPGIQDSLRIEKILDPAHHRIGGAPPLAFHERSHVAAGPVFGFQRTVVFPHHQVSHVMQDRIVAAHVIVRCKPLVDNKMEVTREGMSVYTAVFVPVSVQQGRQVCDRFGKVFQMEGDILDQAGRPLLAQTAHLREDAGAKGPVGRALGLVFRKPDLGAEGLQCLRDGCNLVFQLRPCPGLGLGQHRRQLGQVRTQMRVVHRGKRTDIQHFCGRNQVPGHGHDRPGRRGQIREINHGRRLVGSDRQGLHRHFREEGQGPFRPHQEVGDDIERIRIGYQGQKIQPRHVLDRILIGNPFTQGRIGQYFVAKGFYRPQKIRMRGAEGRPAFLAAGIQDGSVG